MRTVRDQINDAAASIARSMGWKFKEGTNFETLPSPRARQFWAAAVAAYNSFYGDSPDYDAEVTT